MSNGDAMTELARVFVREAEVDPEQDPRVHHLVGGVREALEQARVRADRHGRRGPLGDLESEPVGPEVEPQHLRDRAREAVGAGNVVRIGRGLGAGREVEARYERCPGRITLRSRVLIVVPLPNARNRPPEIEEALAVPHRDHGIRGREVDERHEPRTVADRELLVDGDVAGRLVPLGDEVPGPEARQIGFPRSRTHARGGMALTAPNFFTSL